MKNNAQKTLINVIENIFYYSSIVFALSFFILSILEIFWTISNLGIIECFKNLNSNWQKITSFAALTTISITIHTFISNNKMKRLEYAIKIVEDFDREDFRKARDLTRQIGKADDDGKIAPESLIKLINNNFKGDKNAEELKELCNFTDDDCKKLEESVIFAFNYWERVYNPIKYNAVNNN